MSRRRHPTYGCLKGFVGTVSQKPWEAPSSYRVGRARLRGCFPTHIYQIEHGQLILCQLQNLESFALTCVDTSFGHNVGHATKRLVIAGPTRGNQVVRWCQPGFSRNLAPFTESSKHIYQKTWVEFLAMIYSTILEHKGQLTLNKSKIHTFLLGLPETFSEPRWIHVGLFLCHGFFTGIPCLEDHPTTVSS